MPDQSISDSNIRSIRLLPLVVPPDLPDAPGYGIYLDNSFRLQLINSAGVITPVDSYNPLNVTSPAKAHVRNTSQQSIVSGVWTPLEFPTVDSDSGEWSATYNHFVVSIGGSYCITAQCAINGATPRLGLVINGGLFREGGSTFTIGGITFTHNIWHVELSSGQTVTTYCLVDGGTLLSTLPTIPQEMSIWHI